MVSWKQCLLNRKNGKMALSAEMKLFSGEKFQIIGLIWLLHYKKIAQGCHHLTSINVSKCHRISAIVEGCHHLTSIDLTRCRCIIDTWYIHMSYNNNVRILTFYHSDGLWWNVRHVTYQTPLVQLYTVYARSTRTVPISCLSFYVYSCFLVSSHVLQLLRNLSLVSTPVMLS